MRFPRAIRHAGDNLLGRIPLRIRSGPNHGMRWSASSAGRGAVAGTFEHERVSAILALLRPGDTVWDVGAHKGYVTLAMASAVGQSGHVYAFEPANANQHALRRHIRWNRIRNVTTLPFALAQADRTDRIGGARSSITYRLGTGEQEVVVRSMLSLIKAGVAPPPTVMKIDVEGSEFDVLQGAGAALPADTILFIAIHSAELYTQCRAALEARGFTVHDSAAIRRMDRPTPADWVADPDILAVGPKRTLGPATLRAFTESAAP